MKRRLVILIAFFLLFNAVYGQPKPSAIDSLVKYRVITAKQRGELEKNVNQYQGNWSYNTIVLGELDGIMLRKIFHVNPHTAGIFVSYRNDDPNKQKQDSINTTLRVLLNKINKAGLLSGRVYTSAQKNIDSSSYMAEEQLVGQLAEMSSRFESLAPGKLMPVALELHKNGVVSDSSFQRLVADINGEKIESAFQLNNYCLLNRTFNAKSYTDPPNTWLEQFHREIASILPGLNFTDFSYTTTPDTLLTFGKLPRLKFTISLTCNSRIYKNNSYTFELTKSGEIRPYDNLFFGSLYRIFNKILADEQSPYRLHQVMFHPPGVSGDYLEHIAIMALRGEQIEGFMKEPCMSYMMVSMENYDNTLTSAKVDSTIAGWKQAGLFAHLSEVEIKKATNDAKADDWFSIGRLMNNFPRVIFREDSAFARPRPYVFSLKHLALITHGVMDPTKITQTKTKNGIKLQYLSEGKIHTYIFDTNYGWLDAKFPDFLKKLAQDNDLTGNFYILPDDNAVIYLNNRQYNYLKANQLLNFESKLAR